MAAAGTAAAAAAGRAAAAVAAARQGDFGFNHKPHIGQVDGHRADLFGQFLVDAERQAVVLGRFIVLAGFVEGEGQAGSAAAAGSKVHPDGGLFLAFKIRFKLFSSSVRSSYLQLNLTTIPFIFFSSFSSLLSFDATYICKSVHSNIATCFVPLP